VLASAADAARGVEGGRRVAVCGRSCS
jgi:hypothetical protein